MKVAMESQVNQFDFQKYASMPLIVFLGLGFLITLIVQSSSVTTALTLSALYVGALSFPAAAALVLGSETGTTIKLLLSSIGGSSTKKRIVFGNIMFNLILTIMAFVFLAPLLYLIVNVLNIKNPLIGLVTFSSIVNLGGLVLFLPFMNQFVSLLERFFKGSEHFATVYIQHADLSDYQSALELFVLETKFFLHNCMVYNMELLNVQGDWLHKNNTYNKLRVLKNMHLKTMEEKYDLLKLSQGELQAFYLKMNTKLTQDGQKKLDQLVSSVRSSMHSAKSMKDIKDNIADLSQSSKDAKFDLFNQSKAETTNLYQYLNNILEENKTVNYHDLENILNVVEANFIKALTEFYNAARIENLEEIDLTTFITFNRELFTANKAIIMAAKELLLNADQAQSFNALPVYKT